MAFRYRYRFVLVVDGPYLQEMSNWTFDVRDGLGRELRSGPLLSLAMQGVSPTPLPASTEETTGEEEERDASESDSDPDTL